MRARNFPLLYPTRIFAGLFFVLCAMWYAAASQNNAANYLLLFFTLAIVLVSIPQTLLNGGGLRITAESIKPAFAGQEISVPVEIVNGSSRAKHDCVLTLPETAGASEVVEEIAPGHATRVTLRFPANERGEHEILRLRLVSSYPLGFLASRRHVAVQQRYLIYPRPAGDPRLPLRQHGSSGARVEQITGEGDDFAGVRAYLPGESQRQIDWKAVARGQPLMTKQFTVERDDVLEFDFSAAGGEIEQRLSQLALWVLEAERARRRYGLRMPALQIAPGSGDAHYHRCLRALALYR